MMFSNKKLKALILPLIVEQILAVSVGMLDTIMVASLGESAVSGVSLVDSLNILLIQVFAALATGGAVVASQYIGKNDPEKANRAGKQLVLVTGMISVMIMVVTLLFRDNFLYGIFGHVDADVMKSAQIYLVISVISYPFIALYNSGAALFRSMGNSKVSMIASIIMNVMNFIGNYILIFIIPLGVAGAAISTLFARMFGALMMLYLLRNKGNTIYIDSYFKLGYEPKIIKNILQIGIPTGLENGMFQFGKIAVQGLIATFGTMAITANAVSNNFASLEVIPGSAIGLALVTIVGQCIGANEIQQARAYIKKCMYLAYGSMFILNIFVLLFAQEMLKIYNLSPSTQSTAFTLLVIHGVMAIIVWPFAFTFPNALRATGDAKFTMGVSVLSMWLFRVGASYLFAGYFKLGVEAVWVCMTIDWIFRSICFIIRYRSNKWVKKAIE